LRQLEAKTTATSTYYLRKTSKGFADLLPKDKKEHAGSLTPQGGVRLLKN